MREVCIVGAAQNRYGIREETAREAAAKVAHEAIVEAGLTPRNIEMIFVSNVFGMVESQGHVGPLIATSLGIPRVPSLTIESACASGSVSFREGYISVASGTYDTVLVVGSERVSQLDVFSATSYFAMGSDYTYEGRNGVTFPGLYALMATAYMHKYGATEEQLAAIAVKNHRNGARNPKAHFQKEITIEKVMSSRMVAWPLKLFDCCPFSDGASAVVLASEGRARELSDEQVYVLGSGRAGMTAALHDREDLTRMESARLAAKEAFKQAGVDQKDIDFAEVHDCFTIAEAIALEELGFVERGEGAKTADEGLTEIGGELPVNTSGGLKSKGHPVGATGIGQIIEAYEQLLGRSGDRQVEDAEIGLTHNVGATGGTAAVHIFGRR
ncbi:MAG: thiolase domain-containing protein [Thermoplasmata archaeon]